MRRFVISDLSMSPALAPGDRFVARRLGRPERGTVVFFPHPGRLDMWLAKRVIGLPGETVRIRDGKVLIDWTPLSDWTTESTTPDGEWPVPDGHMFVLSDARHRTLSDSRVMGPVPMRPGYAAWFRYRRGREA